MNIKALGLALILVGPFSISAQAQLLNFNFSFTSSTGNQNAITGEIIGLQNNASSDPSDIIITSLPLSSGINAPPNYSLAANGWVLSGGGTFTVSNGQIASTTAYTAHNSGFSDVLQLTYGTNIFSQVSAPTGSVFDFNRSAATYTETVPEPGQFFLLLLSAMCLCFFWKKYRPTAEKKS